ncbi:nucleolar DEAD-box protein required for synthesis of 60S ribosomal subunit, partial [Coemansia spiralis]
MDDDFVMTIDDADEVPDLEAPIGEPDAPRRAAHKGGKQAKRKRGGDADGDIAAGFVVDLDADGLDAVPQSLDFTLARASLKKRNNPGLFSTLDDKIAASRRAAKIARKTAATDEGPLAEDAAAMAVDAPDEDGEHSGASDGPDEAQSDGEGEGGESDDEDIEEPVPQADAEGASNIDDDDEESESESESESDGESESEEDGGSDEGSDDESEVDEIEEARKRAYFAPESGKPEDIPDSFTTMNLSRQIMKGLTKLGFTQPTPIQARTIPVGLLGKDVCGGAQTGSGKTAAFLVPILERLLYRPKDAAATRVLILCPTRELAIQCHNVGTKLAAFTDVAMCLCVGGLALKPQEAELRLRPDVVIATPGRLIDHLRNSASFHLDGIEILVMDEADRMLEDGFEEELTEIVRACPKKRQTMLFSATMTDNVDKLIRLSLNKPVRAQIDPPKSAASGLTQEFVRVRTNRDEDRTALLAALCKRHTKRRCIIFFRSKA